MPNLNVSTAKSELRSAFIHLADQLRSADASPDVSSLFWILDGGNGAFYLYVLRSSDGPPSDWGKVLETDIAGDGRFSEVVAHMNAICALPEISDDADIDELLATMMSDDDDDPYVAVLEDGSTEEIESGDDPLNAFFSRLIVEVMEEPGTQQQFDGLLHPMGCVAYIADDEVNAHEQVITHRFRG